MTLTTTTLITSLILLFASPIYAASSQASEKRTALIIGNSNYASASLKNPANDAKDIADQLKNLGFSVALYTDISRKEMRKAIREFGEKLKTNRGVGLFYYAGHGMQVKGINYLIPLKTNIMQENEVIDEAIDANLVLRKMEDASNRLNMVILDACRNNPFARSFRSSSRGLAQMEAPSGSLILYATAAGSVASDGYGRNGTFTKYLLKYMQVKGLEVSQMIKRVRVGVRDETSKLQTPWNSSSLTGDFYFIPPDKNTQSSTQVATTTTTDTHSNTMHWDKGWSVWQ